MRLKTLLRNAILNVTMLLGLPAQSPPPAQPAPVRLTSQPDLAADAQNRGIQFTQDLGGYTEKSTEGVKAHTDSAQLLTAAFGGWPMTDYDPALVRPLSLETLSNYRADDYTFSAETQSGYELTSAKPDVFAPNFPDVEKKVLSGASIQFEFISVRTEADVNLDLGIGVHEVVHALHHRRETALELLGQPAAPNAAASRLDGVGPFVEASLAKHETPEQTRARHERIAHPGKDDGAIPEYNLLYSERRSYLTTLMLVARTTHAWEREPATRQELWAALYNAVGGLPPGKDEVNRYLASPEGKKMLQKFPAPVPDVGLANAETRLRDAIEKIPVQDRAEMYREEFPRMYGELAEDFNDPKGLVKMGFPASPVYSMAFLDELQSETHWTLGEWRQAASRIEPEKLEILCELSLANHQPLALQALMELAEVTPMVYKLTDNQKSDLLQGALQEVSQAHQPMQLAAARQGVQLLCSFNARLPDRPEMQFVSVTEAGEKASEAPKIPHAGNKAELHNHHYELADAPAPAPDSVQEPGRVRSK